MSRKIRKDKGPVPPLRQLKILCEQKPEVGEEIYAWTQDGVSSQEDIRFSIEKRFGIKLSFDNKLSQWLSWWLLKQDYAVASTSAADMAELLSKVDPNVTPEKVKAFGELVMTDFMIKARDVKGFVQLSRLDLQRRSLEHEQEKWRESMRTKLEAGLEALFKSIQGNAEALAAYEQLKTAVAKKK